MFAQTHYLSPFDLHEIDTLINIEGTARVGVVDDANAFPLSPLVSFELSVVGVVLRIPGGEAFSGVIFGVDGVKGGGRGLEPDGSSVPFSEASSVVLMVGRKVGRIDVLIGGAVPRLISPSAALLLLRGRRRGGDVRIRGPTRVVEVFGRGGRRRRLTVGRLLLLMRLKVRRGGNGRMMLDASVDGSVRSGDVRRGNDGRRRRL